MITIPLQNIPNQAFDFFNDDVLYTLKLRTCGVVYPITVADLYINNERVLKGARCVSGFPIIPYKYLQNGNFIFVTQNDKYPNYKLFGVNQFLVYATKEELQ